MSERRPRLQDLVDRAVARGLLEVYTTMPGRVVKWDASKGRANVQPLLKEPFYDEEDQRQVDSLPVVPGVPVQADGSGGYRTTYPISDGTTTIDEQVAPGTLGVLHFSRRSLDKWLSGSGAEVDPEIDHAHALTDAFFVPGLRTFGSPWSSWPTDHMTVGADGGVQVHIRKTMISAGDEATSKLVAIAEKVQNYLTALSGAINGWTPVANDGGAALKTALSSAGIIGGTWGTDVAATKLKAE